MRAYIFLIIPFLYACEHKINDDEASTKEIVNVDDGTDFYEFIYRCDGDYNLLLAFHMHEMSIRYRNKNYTLNEIPTDSGLLFKGNGFEFFANGQEWDGLPINAEFTFNEIKLKNCQGSSRVDESNTNPMNN